MSNIDLAVNRIAILESELKSLQAKQREESRELAASRRWNKVKTLPSDEARAIVWSERIMKLAWFSDGRWFSYDGTWFIKAQDEIHGVTHWMATDWLGSDYLPPCGPGFVNSVRYLWSMFLGRAQDAASMALPKSMSRNAQLSRKVSFYRNRSTGEIMTGMPEKYAAPRGYEKVVCNNVAEAESWSQRQREWDNSKHGRIQEERERVEGPMRAERRSEMHNLMANSRNAANREFLRRALEKDASRPDPTRYKRESYLHAEAYDQNH